MHLVVPFAAPLSEAGRAALRGLRLAGLGRLLAAAGEPELDRGDEWSLSPPHERALARAHGWPIEDGRLPFAAVWAAADGLAVGERAVGLVTPANWHLGTEQVTMTDPAALALDGPASRRLLEAVADLFTSEGFELLYGAPLRWYLCHPSLASLATASLDRVVGRNVDRWLTSGAETRLLRRLQNEVQMRLHAHPLNAEREAQGLPPVNSFWLSGCGRARPVAAAVQVDDRLRASALAEDWPAWAASWSGLDAAWAGAPPARLTLCGERSALTLALGPRSAWQRLRAAVRKADAVACLEAL